MQASGVLLDGYGRGPDQAQPDGWSSLPLRIAPDGTITFDFEGHIHAAGVDLDATTAPDASHVVEWLTVPGGALVAWVAGFSVAGGEDGLQLHGQDAQDATRFGNFEVRVPDPASGFGPLISASLRNGGATLTKTLLHHDRRSDFLQLPTFANLQAQAGVVNAGLPSAIGNQNPVINLPIAWPNNHLAFIATVSPQALANFNVTDRGARVSTLGTGVVFYSIATAVTAVECHWVSFGN